MRRDKPTLLDACCGAGGATVGYQRAGFLVMGVDIEPQPDYPGDAFHQGDAVEFVRRWGHLFDFIHGSWPCQKYCALTNGTNTVVVSDERRVEHPDLIPTGREAMLATGRPWVIENVAGAPIRKDLKLCGEMFGLAVQRHRYFEAHGWTPEQPAHPPHRGRVAGYRHGEWFDGPYFAVYGDGGGKGSVADWQGAMGIDWTDVRHSIAEAIPPAYAEEVGRQFLGVR